MSALTEIRKYVEDNYPNQTDEYRMELITRAHYNFRNGAGSLSNAMMLAEKATEQVYRRGRSQYGGTARPRGY